MRTLLVVVAAALVLWVVTILAPDGQPPAPQPVGDVAPQSGRYDLEPIVPPSSGRGGNRVADISVHTAGDLEIIFDRVEELLERPRSGGEEPLISLVLHGPEVEFFAFRNYQRYKALVDHAAKLAALGAVDISICQTQMRNFGIEEDQVPSFLRQVSFGPNEVERLVNDGYVTM